MDRSVRVVRPKTYQPQPAEPGSGAPNGLGDPGCFRPHGSVPGLLKRYLRLSLAALASLVVYLCGCAGHGDSEGGIEETYAGVMTFDKNPGIVGYRFTDTVRLTIDGSTYTFETLVHTPGSFPPPACNVRGRVDGFGRNSASFEPTDTLTQGCSSEYTLRGTFPTVFKEDSLIMVKTDSVLDAFYDFRLSR